LSLKIVSLVPSQTELLYHLGLNEEVIGITKFCIHPEHWFKAKTRIGGTKNIDIKKIQSLEPTLVIANKEENVKEQVEALQAFTKVVVTDVNTLQNAIEMIESIGNLTDRLTQAQSIIKKINTEFSNLKNNLIATKTIKVAYLIWKNPYMTVGGDTFIHNIITTCNFTNVFANKLRYPITRIEEIEQLQPHFVFLSSEPYPFKEKDITELQIQLPNTKIIIIDGEMFSWYGSRLIKVAKYLAQLTLKLRI
jgi:ABC-type Fe3+-hydroxamate transport system substrate-binding protein